MNIKKLISAVCLAAGLAFAMPSLSMIGGNLSGSSVVMAADGWNQDSNGYYYLQDGVKLTGTQVINGATYYFNSAGYRMTGAVKTETGLYYFSPTSGKLLTGMKGMATPTQGSNIYYFFLKKANGSLAVNQWVKYKGEYYYAGADGKIMFGTVKINGWLYHLTPTGRITGYEKSSYNKKYYYANSYGKLRTGLRTINGEKYYFNPTTGERQVGHIKIGKYYYYFSRTTGKAQTTGWSKSNGEYYYHDSKGRRVTGFRKINNKRYYLSPSQNGARAHDRWAKIGTVYYYFNSKGVMQTGFIKAADGKTYYSNSKGARQYGWKTIGGRKYYFNKTTGVMKTGWFTSSGKTYYLNPSKSSSTYGAAITGWAQIKGETYYFNTDATLIKGAWMYDENSKAYYYLDSSTGKVLKGKQVINGVTYDLGSTGAYKKALTGEWLIKVNRVMNCITVYRGGVPIKAIVCSTAADGVSTPLGWFTIKDKLRWHELNGPTWGQYCSHITSDILFHSVPCTRYNDNHSLKAAEFNKLGLAASGGCIRLTVADAKWIYDNCPVGTKVYIYDDTSSPGPLGKPTAPKIPLTQTYDPTDPAA